MKRTLALLLLILAGGLIAEEDIVRIGLQSSTADSSGQYVLLVHIKEGWHINSADPLDDYSIPAVLGLRDTETATITSISYPPGEVKATRWGGDLSLYEGELKIPFRIDADRNTARARLEFTYQACNDLTCLPPATASLNIDIAATSSKIAATTGSERSVYISEQTEASQTKTDPTGSGPFGNKGLFVVLLLVFVMGLALNLTPCVYPLIPITMGYFLAQKESRSPVLLAFMYVIGLAITYSIIGTLAAFGGSMMGSLLAHPVTLIFFSLLMLALSLSMFGLYEFRLPRILTQAGGGSRNGAPGALLMGLTMGIVAAPCVGPFVVSLLGYVAQKGSVFTGFITFFVLALGLGLPYLFLGIFSTRIADLPRSGEWLNGIRIFFGLALIGMSIYFLLPLLSGRIADMLLPVYMITAAVYYGVVDRSGISVRWFSRLKVILAMAVLAAGIMMVKPADGTVEQLSWDNYSVERLEEAVANGKPVIIDFYADWCAPCKELEHITFADPEVIEILSSFTRLKVDMTISRPSHELLRETYDIVGVPTIVFYDMNGVRREELRLNGFERPKDFLQRLDALLHR